MAPNVRLRVAFPIFHAYGATQTFLEPEEAAATTLEGRIKSVFPFIVRRCLSFHKTLKPRERVNYDPEDILSEIWLTLTEKDALWSPDRGKYITFAGMVMDREFCSIRDRARTIHAPRNSSCRMKEYRKEEADGSITDCRRRTAEDIERTNSIASSTGYRGATDEEGFSCEPTITDDPLATLAARERADGMRSGLRDALERVSLFEAEAVTRLAGFGGREATTVKELALEVGRTEVEVRRAKDRAMLKIRQHLAATGNPFFAERN